LVPISSHFSVQTDRNPQCVMSNVSQDVDRRTGQTSLRAWQSCDGWYRRTFRGSYLTVNRQLTNSCVEVSSVQPTLRLDKSIENRFVKPFVWDMARRFVCNDLSRQPETLQGADFENDGQLWSENRSKVQLLCADHRSSTSTESTWPVPGSAQRETVSSTERVCRAEAVSDRRDERSRILNTCDGCSGRGATTT